MESKDSEKQVLAILKKKKTYTYRDVLYMKDKPSPVNMRTARYLKNTGLFSFSKIEK